VLQDASLSVRQELQIFVEILFSGLPRLVSNTPQKTRGSLTIYLRPRKITLLNMLDLVHPASRLQSAYIACAWDPRSSQIETPLDAVSFAQ
jgi:hypothetical protein